MNQPEKGRTIRQSQNGMTTSAFLTPKTAPHIRLPPNFLSGKHDKDRGPDRRQNPDQDKPREN
jgi:hypothetical protein